MNKIFRVFLALILIVIGIVAWLVFGSATAFSGKKKFLYIREGQNNKDSFLAILEREDVISNQRTFNFLADRMDMWSRLKPGKFEIPKGASALDIVRKLRNNSQSPVNLVINKLRFREDLAKLIGKQFAIDSSAAATFLNSNDSLKKFGVDTSTFMTLVIPNTYTYTWTASMDRIITKLKDEKIKFWDKNDRSVKAAAQGLSTEQVYILASIVEEETNLHEEKGNMASVFSNRLNKGMALGADPTIKYALRDFSLTRLYYKHLDVVSPYNTYRNKGFPPGPICTPSTITIDKVLEAPKTDYFYYVALGDGTGSHHFSTTFEEHIKYATEYHQKQDKRGNR